MKVILSPAMNMDTCSNDTFEKTIPIFKNKSCELAKELKKLNPFDLEIALSISPTLLDKVFEYYLDFDCDKIDEKGTQALLSFNGLAYKNLNVSDFTKEDFNFANNHLRILSAMYGILKPSDIIQQYRLDFMCNFGKKGIDDKKLYDFWSDTVYKELFKDKEPIVAICSKEYEKLIKPFVKKSDRYIVCEFLINKNGKFKAFATASKMARGQMARYIIKNKIEDIEKIKNFEYDGFKFSEYHSSENRFCFIK